MTMFGQGLYGELAALRYDHHEGGRYIYVKFLSLTRDLWQCCKTPEQVVTLRGIREQFNTALCERFGPGQEHYFIDARTKILQMLGDSASFDISGDVVSRLPSAAIH